MSLLEIYQGIFSIHILTLVQSVQIFTEPFKKNKTLLKTKGSGECLKILRLYYNVIIQLLINKKRRITMSKDPKSSSLATSPFINFNQHYPHNHLHVCERDSISIKVLHKQSAFKPTLQNFKIATEKPF